MYFSPSTIVLVAGMLASPLAVSAGTITERSTSLCNQKNYGATGFPWQHTSTPGSFCSSKKPSNSKAWQAIPYADGYDTVTCNAVYSWLSFFGIGKSSLNICNGGNKKASLPKGCNPPKKHQTTAAASIKTSSSVTKASSSAVASSSVVASSSAVASSNAVVSSSASAVGSSASSAAPSVVSSAANTASSVAVVNDSASSVTSSAPASSSSAAAAVDPLSDPVCELNYQVQYTNFTLVAPNGVWTGLTVGSAAQDASYMTYTLATSVDDCLNACSKIEGCVFVNTYYDVNETENDLPKHTDGVLTCAMFSSCVPTTNNNNWGGQDDPNEIYNSDGYCLSTAC